MASPARLCFLSPDARLRLKWAAPIRNLAAMIKPETKTLHDEIEKRAGYLWRYL